MENGRGEGPTLEFFLTHRKKGFLLSVHVDDVTMGGKKRQSETHVGQIDESSESGGTSTSVR